MSASKALAKVPCVPVWGDITPADVLELPWIARHQLGLTLSGPTKTMQHWNMPHYTRAILFTLDPLNLCQPFQLVHRNDLYALIPDLAQFLESQDVDCPPISLQDREVVYKVNDKCNHFLGSAVKEVKLFAVVDVGKGNVLCVIQCC